MTDWENAPATGDTVREIPGILIRTEEKSPYIDILRYGGEIPQPGQKKGTAIFCCPDVETINVFKIERIDEEKED